MSNPLLDISSVEKEVEAPTERLKHSKQKALELSINEGSAASLSASLGGSYITPFALLLKANAFQIGLLSSLSGLISPLSQLFGSKLMESRSRKKIVLYFVLLEALMWLPIAALSYFAWKGIFPLALPYAVVILFTLLTAFSGIAFPAWFSWMGDLVPVKEKGKYYTKRNLVAGIVGLAGVLIGAFVLDAFKTKGLALLGFSILFFLAFFFRMLSYSIFKKQFSPKFKLKKDYYFSFWAFIKRFDNFGKFSVYRLFFYLSMYIASPFFAVYMLEDLNFSYVTFIIVSMSASAFYLLFSPLIGKFSDRFGNVKLFYIGNLAFALTPFLWLFIKSPLWLIAIPQLISGIGNAALIISFTNFTYDAVSPQKRGICAAYSNLLVGFGVFFGSLLGGAIIKYVPLNFIAPILFVFLISAVLRLLVGLLFLPAIKEERKVEGVPPMHLNLSHPFKTIQAEVSWFKNVFS